MALIERITLPLTAAFVNENECLGAFPGLRISIRSTTSSFSDYPEWHVEDLRGKTPDSVITDGLSG